ncbi:MAG: hypothetical protein D6723_09260, partial [Acidobacteria bacterium]
MGRDPIVGAFLSRAPRNLTHRREIFLYCGRKRFHDVTNREERPARRPGGETEATALPEEPGARSLGSAKYSVAGEPGSVIRSIALPRGSSLVDGRCRVVIFYDRLTPGAKASGFTLSGARGMTTRQRLRRKFYEIIWQ